MSVLVSKRSTCFRKWESRSAKCIAGITQALITATTDLRYSHVIWTLLSQVLYGTSRRRRGKIEHEQGDRSGVLASSERLFIIYIQE
ncbi:protein of unknown function (plasmid) [Cupriavidus taiwanensis]|uniref:Uncharacterized protein n=1 Tax=Cupriavidus taiwanensis TaxID=164546 RepID=A0A375EDK5_9BURK|nr:protein of unknown function [Cupriavidus taiwanensis]SOZ72213.1 protein of unknown function [Cupriavidus taiwanensis]SOZ74516.1 protein of unknown function [Cupriavidus taiwanensis]